MYRCAMYVEYMRHIKKMLGEMFCAEECARQFERIERDAHDTQWIPVIHNAREVGFIIICQAPNCHPDADYYIEDSFVLPAFQNKGLMQKTVQEFVKTNPGKYCLFIIDCNKPARHMWPAVFEKLGYQPLPLKEVLIDHPGITQYGWQP